MSYAYKTTSYAYEAILLYSSLHHLCKVIIIKDSVSTSPLLHLSHVNMNSYCMSTQIATERAHEVTNQYLDTEIIQSHHTAHCISSPKLVSFAQLTGGGVL